jgi:hypothetical protein
MIRVELLLVEKATERIAVVAAAAHPGFDLHPALDRALLDRLQQRHPRLALRRQRDVERQRPSATFARNAGIRTASSARASRIAASKLRREIAWPVNGKSMWRTFPPERASEGRCPMRRST